MFRGVLSVITGFLLVFRGVLSIAAGFDHPVNQNLDKPETTSFR